MSRRLPPLNALRAFECAGRHLSFTRAAYELCVTPGAVSRQIKLLEEFLDIQLFERHNREIRLTLTGQDYLTALTDTFARMDAATRRLTESRRDRPLNFRSEERRVGKEGRSR